MTTDETVEAEAFAELARIERFEKLFASGEKLEDAEVIAALIDTSEPIRAEALDYLAGVLPTKRMIEDIERLAASENAVQCVARIAFLSHVWRCTKIRSCLIYRPTLDEAEYIAVWDDAGKALISRDLGAAIRLCAHAQYSDWELKTVAASLIETLVEMDQEIQGILSRVSASLALLK